MHLISTVKLLILILVSIPMWIPSFILSSIIVLQLLLPITLCLSSTMMNDDDDVIHDNNTTTTLFRHRKLIEIIDDTIEIVENSFVIRFHNNTSHNDTFDRMIENLISQCDNARVLHIYRLAIYAVALVDVSDQDLITILNNPDVISAERDTIVYAFSYQEGLDIDQWGLDRIDQESCIACNNDDEDSSINGPIYDFAYLFENGIYRYDYTGNNVQAYIIDSGIQSMHNEFTYINETTNEILSRVTCGLNLRDNLNETCEDEWGHGTHVAGIIGGNTYGVAKNIELINVKVFGSDATCRFVDLLAAIEYVIIQKENNRNQSMLINLSLGTSRIADILNEAVNKAVDVGIPVIVAAGNGADDACTYSPASAGQVITVGASTSNDTYYVGSNYGRCIDLYAPGALIQSSWIGPTNDINKTLSGTSMAAPFVSGAVALYFEREPLALPHTIRYYLLSDALMGVLSSPPNYTTDNNVIDFLFNPTPNILLNVQSLFIKTTMTNQSSSIPSPGPTTSIFDLFSDNTPTVAVDTKPTKVGSIYNQAPTVVTSQMDVSGTSRIYSSSMFACGITTILILIILSS